MRERAKHERGLSKDSVREKATRGLNMREMKAGRETES